LSPIKYILALFLAFIYVCVGYFLERSNFTHLIILFGSAFAIYFFIIYLTKDKKETAILLWISMGFRLLFIIAIPCLSDDYFRFLWDGKLFIHGFNPYLTIPSEIINTNIAKTTGLNNTLFLGLNSPNYYSVYPPINQLLFAIGAYFSKHSLLAGIIALRIPIIIAEFFTIKYIKKLLVILKLPQNNVLWYALNPLVIIELSGNLHYEGMMLLCLIIAIYWLLQHKWAGAAIWWAMAISIKLIPILFLPILIKRLGWAKSIWFYIITTLALTFTFLPFLDTQLIHHIATSIDLYFRTFEFNASIYYIVRWFGYQKVGYDIIQTAGPIMSVITFVLIILVYFIKNNSWHDSFKKMLFAYTIYLLMASIVHPWYVINLVVLSVFIKNYKYALIWSVLIVSSYYAYSQTDFTENYLLIAIEYSVVIAYLVYEIIRQTNKKKGVNTISFS